MFLFRGREAHSRSFAKAVTWRITGTVDTFVISAIVTGKFTMAGLIAAPVPSEIQVLLLDSRYRRSSQRSDCLAGHAGLELRNVVANYPFESSRRFPGIDSNSGHRDY